MSRIRIVVVLVLLLMNAGCSTSQEKNTSVPAPAKTGNPLAGQIISTFQATDLAGQPVTESIFKSQQLTMLNLWGTFCGPCIQEMPDIEKLQSRYKQRGVLVLGVVVDKDLQAAKRIVATQKATYTSIIPDAALEKSVISAFDYVPATIFVDANGRVLTPLVSGSNSVEGYSAVIDSILRDLEASGGKS